MTDSVTIARNERTSVYEVHRSGCNHLNASHLHPMRTVDASPTDAAAAYEAENDDVATKLGPCARR